VVIHKYTEIIALEELINIDDFFLFNKISSIFTSLKNPLNHCFTGIFKHFNDKVNA